MPKAQKRRCLTTLELPSTKEKDSSSLPTLDQTASHQKGGFTKAFFVSSVPELGEERAREKFKNAVKNPPLLFFRSFVRAFYKDLKPLAAGLDVGLCFGDLHPENFGWETFLEGDAYVFNDLDDSGDCPILFDILRYFVALRLQGESEENIRKLVQLYLATLREEQAPKPLAAKFKMDLDKVLASRIGKFVADNHFNSVDPVSHANETVRVPLRALWETVPQLTDLEMIDVANFRVDKGGSAGNNRLWVLAKTEKYGLDLLEFKPQETPGTSGHGWPEIEGNRFDVLANAFWPGKTRRYYFTVGLLEQRFLVRTRRRKTLDLDKLERKDQFRIFQTQVGLIAEHHRQYVTKDEGWEDWLSHASKHLAGRYRDFIKSMEQ